MLLRLPISHYCHKVEWALADLGIEVDRTHVWFRDLLDIRDVNPENTVPVLELQDRLVCGSSAILHWAADESPVGHTLYPSTQVAAWEAWADATVGPLARRDAYRTLYEQPLRYSWNPAVWLAGLFGRRVILAVLKSYKARRDYEDDDRDRAGILGRIGEQLRAQGPFLFGVHKTAADYATAALLQPLLRVHGLPQCRHVDWRLLQAYVRRVKPSRSALRRRHRFEDVRARMAGRREG